MMSNTTLVVLVLVGAGWMLQLYLSYKQMRRFYARLSELRKQGLTAIGMGGTRYSGRAYAVVVINPDTRRIVRVEKLMGLTIFASLKPIAELSGQSFDALLEGRLVLNGPEKLQTAILNAAKDINNHLNKQLHSHADTTEDETRDASFDASAATG